MNKQFTETIRFITNLIRTGTVSEVDPVNCLCRVKTGDIETNWNNWLILRVSKTRTGWQPSVDEQAALLSPGGNLETAFALPTIYSNAFPPLSNPEDGTTTVFRDGGWFKYEPDSGQLLIKNIRSVHIEAADVIQLITDQFGVQASQTSINGQAVTGIDHIRQSMRDILITSDSIRVARHKYGSLLSRLIDQPQNEAIRLQVMAAVYTALSQWEPRITLSTVNITHAFDGSIVVELTGQRNDGSLVVRTTVRRFILPCR